MLLIPAITLTVMLATQAPVAQESDSRKTVWDGVFTMAQAERGREAYALHCSSCHSEDLSGMSGPALKDQPFVDNWREDSLKSLFTFIRTRMPNRAPGSLREETYVDILAHILAVNTFPAGSKELSTDAVGNIRIVGKDGPAPIPNFSLITLVGCLSQGPENTWALTNVPAAVRTRQEKPTAPEVQVSAAKPLGTDTFRLVYIDSLRPDFLPERHVGHKLHAQGYLLRNDKGLGLSVTSLEAVASTCTE
ncbi:MAG TPA: cytochrome c [Terriglobia bacterium]|nr:cytochrome c [Terriglobia bacterium]